MDIAILKERQAELAEVEREAIEVRELFVDVQAMVGEQGEVLTAIEDHAVMSGANVSAGTAHLGDVRKVSFTKVYGFHPSDAFSFHTGTQIPAGLPKEAVLLRCNSVSCTCHHWRFIVSTLQDPRHLRSLIFIWQRWSK